MTHGEPIELQLAQQSVVQESQFDVDWTGLGAEIDEKLLIVKVACGNQFGPIASDLRNQAKLAGARLDYVTRSARREVDVDPKILRAAQLLSPLFSTRIELSDGWTIFALMDISRIAFRQDIGGPYAVHDDTEAPFREMGANIRDAFGALAMAGQGILDVVPDDLVTHKGFSSLDRLRQETRKSDIKLNLFTEAFEHAPTPDEVKVFQMHAFSRIVELVRKNGWAEGILEFEGSDLSDEEKTAILESDGYKERAEIHGASLIFDAVQGLWHSVPGDNNWLSARAILEYPLDLSAEEVDELRGVETASGLLKRLAEMSPPAGEVIDVAMEIVKGSSILSMLSITDHYAKHTIEREWYDKNIDQAAEAVESILLWTRVASDQILDRYASHDNVPFEVQVGILKHVADFEQKVLAQLRSELQRLLEEGAIDGKGFRAIERHLKADISESLEETFNLETQMNTERALQEIEAFSVAAKTEITHLEQPYEYTSKRLRSYENGTKILRELNSFLDKQGSLRGEDVGRMLALMMLDSEHAEDPNEYFAQLKQVRHAIEEQLANLQYVGINHDSDVTAILRWVDEMIDAGETVKFTPLECFMEQYFLSDLGELEDVSVIRDDPVPDEPEEEPGYDRSVADEMIQEYFATLADVLEEAGVVFSDVAVFPPGDSRKPGESTIEAPGQPKGFIDIDPRRLYGLIDLKKTFESHGRHAQIIVTAPAKWSTLPYFALMVKDSSSDTRGVCFLENVQHGTATYSFAVDGELIQSWEEIAAMSRPQAREFGAISMVHPDKQDPGFGRHYALRLRNFGEIELAKLIS